MKTYLHILFYVIFLAFSAGVQAQVVTNVQTPQNLVLNTLIGSGLYASNISSQGAANQFAHFTALNTNLGLDSGIVLTTSGITGIYSFAGNSSIGAPTSPFTGGYAPLQNYNGGYNTNDAAVITFDFIPITDTIQFDYVFASEEYNEYVNSSFNDVFAFLLSGPNPNGPAYNQTNIALIPNTSQFVSINTVNNGYSFGCANGPCNNCQYFVDNCNGTSVIFDAFTTPITAIAPVYPCSTYTITLAVANSSDHALQSAVFLEANSFSATGVSFSIATNTVSAVDTLLSEGCGLIQLVVTRNSGVQLGDTIQLTYSGSAANGSDYLLLPDSMVFAPGQASDTLIVQPIFDTLIEGMDTITICAIGTGCNSTNTCITLLLQDYFYPTADAGPDTVVIDCTGDTLIGTAALGTYPWLKTWKDTQGNIIGQISDTNTTFGVFIIPTADGYYTFTVQDTCGNTATDSIFVDFDAPVFAGFSMDEPTDSLPVEGCGTANIVLHRTEFINQAKTYPIQITGTATNGTDYPLINTSITFQVGDTAVIITIAPNYDVVPEGTETVTIGIVDTLCNGVPVPFSQTVYIQNINPLSVDAGQDFTIFCPRVPFTLNSNAIGGRGMLTFSWTSTNLNFSANTPIVPNILPNDTTIYYLVATDSCGYQAFDTLTVYRPDNPVADFTFNNINYCEPATVPFTNLSVAVSGDSLFYEWDFDNGNQSTAKNPVNVFATAQTYNVTLIVTNEFNCKDTAAKPIIVHPKPEALPYWGPQDATLLSPTISFYNKSYPDIVQWYWETGDGTTYTVPEFDHSYTKPGTFYALLAVTTQYGCVDTARFEITIKPDISLYIPNTFTPNGDGLNDTWGPIGEEWVNMEMTVFNRWGQKVFESVKPDYQWNGFKFNTGNRCPQGSYVYRIRIVDIKGEAHLLMGHVNLLK